MYAPGTRSAFCTSRTYSLSWTGRSSRFSSLRFAPTSRITDFEFSLIAGLAFAIFYAVLGIPIGLVADRWSRRNLVAIGIALWSVMTGLCGLAGNYLHLFVARLGVGVGEGTLTPSAISLISDLSRGSAAACRSTCTRPASTAASASPTYSGA